VSISFGLVNTPIQVFSTTQREDYTSCRYLSIIIWPSSMLGLFVTPYPKHRLNGVHQRSIPMLSVDVP
jgi:hypothetical protein